MWSSGSWLDQDRNKPTLKNAALTLRTSVRHVFWSTLHSGKLAILRKLCPKQLIVTKGVGRNFSRGGLSGAPGEGSPAIFQFPGGGAQPRFLVASMVKMKEFSGQGGPWPPLPMPAYALDRDTITRNVGQVMFEWHTVCCEWDQGAKTLISVVFLAEESWGVE